MADNFSVRNASGTSLTFKSTESGGVHSPVHRLEPSTSGGLTIHKNLDVDESGDNIKASAGQVYRVFAGNTNASARYLKLYNKATAPTVGTDVPVITLYLPTGAFSFDLSEFGAAFSTGIGIGATTGVADNDTGAPGANEVVATVLYS